MVGLESLASLVAARQVSEVERIALARVRDDLDELVGSTYGKVMVDVSTITEADGVAGGVDQNDDTTLQPISMESDDNVPMDLSVPKPVDMSVSPIQGVNIELTEQASVPPIFTSVISVNPNVLAEQMESIEVFMETTDGMIPL